MKRRYVFGLAALAVVAVLSSVLAFGLGVYFGQKGEEAFGGGTTTTTFLSTSTTSTTFTSSTTVTTSTTIPGPDEEIARQEALIRALNKKFNPFPILNITCSGGGDRIRLWADSVGFKINVTNIGAEMGYVETTAETSRGVSLEVRPETYNSVPGDNTEISILVSGKDVRNGDNITITSKLLGKRRVITLPVERSSDKYTETAKSGREEGCGAAATYDREH